MSHYFRKDDTLSRNLSHFECYINNTTFRFSTSDGVFSKDGLDYATDILLNNIPPLKKSSTLLDLGCGYGCIGIVLAKLYSLDVTAVDVNETAIDLARINFAQNNVSGKLILSDCFENVNGRFNTIVINPPIHAGKATTYKMYEDSIKHLLDGGSVYIVTLKKHGAETTFKKLCEVFDNNIEIIYRKKGHYIFKATLK